ncbi:ZnF_C2H2 [Nesidiocoris tenuis]|uniref:ZnF_C2H2 n=1 Tax=Nesidiocoris tenuis TaxID=355587 RepID=A0ABN7AV59_9HEMI|nr:ZnF_C2H2 [Nesidiocoris tenuis]
MENTKKCAIKWKKYLNNIQAFIRQVAASKQLTDVSIVCEDPETGRFLKLRAHKFVLCALSSYFSKYFANDDGNTSSIFMQGIPYQYMTYLLDFMYFGEIQIPSKLLEKFLDYGNQLRVEGLQGVTYSAIVSARDSSQNENTASKIEPPAKKANPRKRASDGPAKSPVAKKSAIVDSTGPVRTIRVTSSIEPVESGLGASLDESATEPMDEPEPRQTDKSLLGENGSPGKRRESPQKKIETPLEREESPRKRGESPMKRKEALQKTEGPLENDDTIKTDMLDDPPNGLDVPAQLDETPTVGQKALKTSASAGILAIKSEPVDEGYSALQNGSPASTPSGVIKPRKKRSYVRRKPETDPVQSGEPQPQPLPSDNETPTPSKAAPDTTAREFASWPNTSADAASTAGLAPMADGAPTPSEPATLNGPPTSSEPDTTDSAPAVADFERPADPPSNTKDSPPAVPDVSSVEESQTTVTDATPVASPSAGQVKRSRSSKKPSRNKNAIDTLQNGISPMAGDMTPTNQNRTASVDGSADTPTNQVKKKARASKKRASAVGVADGSNSAGSSPIVDDLQTQVDSSGTTSPKVKAKRQPRSAKKRAILLAALEGTSTAEEHMPPADVLEKLPTNQNLLLGDKANIPENIPDSYPSNADDSTADAGPAVDTAGLASELRGEEESMHEFQKEQEADSDVSPKRSRTIKKPARLLDKNFVEDDCALAKKRRPNPFFIFCSETRPALREQFPGEGLTAIQKRLSSMWSEFDPYTKAKYQRDED